MRKHTTLFKKMDKYSKTHFIKEGTRMAHKHMTRCSSPLFIGEMRIKATMSYHFALIRMATVKQYQVAVRTKGN